MAGTERDDALRELGRLAAERREEANLTIEDIYERTRIRTEFLKGIENGSYEGFPELIYIKGFVRTYLHVIGAEDLKDDFMAWLNKAQPATPDEPVNVLGNGTSPTKGFKPVSHFWLFLVLLLALAGTGGYVWYVWSNGELDLSSWGQVNPLAALKTPLSGDLKHEVPAAAASPDVLTSPDVLPVSEDLKPEPKPEPEPKPKPKPSLEIAAKSDVWMKVTIGGQTLFSKTLKEGASVSWDLTGEAKVIYGRPNAALVTLNGKALGPANPKGSKRAETYFYLPDGTYKKAKSK